MAAVNPTRASSRSGTPAPRSASARIARGRTARESRRGRTARESRQGRTAREGQFIRTNGSNRRPGQPASDVASTPSAAAIAATLTGPSRRIRGAGPVTSTIVDAACCADDPESR